MIAIPRSSWRNPENGPAADIGVIRSVLRASLTFAAAVQACSWSTYARAEPPTLQTAPSTSDDDGQEITVTARRKGVRSEIDRTIFDVQTGDDAASLNATDILRRIPGLTVAPSGGVTVRGGAGVSFLVDGKPVRRELALAIPASQIERVELITSPPAEYASDGDALLNIVLKKVGASGWGGSVSGKLDTLGGYRAGTSASLSSGKTSGNASLSLRSEPGIIDTARRTSFSGGASDAATDQLIQTEERSTFRQVSGQIKLTHQLADDQTLDLVAGASYNVNPHDDRIIVTDNGSIGPAQTATRRIIDFEGLYPSGSLTFRKEAKNHDFTLSVDANGGKSDEDRMFIGQSPQRLRDGLSFSYVQASSDYTIRSDSGRKLTLGALLAVNRVTDVLRLSGFTSAQATQNIDFTFERRSFAAYVSVETKALGFDVKSGIRLEGFTQDIGSSGGDIAGYDGTIRLLPSLNLSRQVGDGQTLKAGFSVRLEKPDALNFNPALKYNSSVQADQGNPFLRPVRKVQAEISYVTERRKRFLEIGAYARKAFNEVNSLQFLLDDALTVTSFVNLGYSETIGTSTTLRINPDRKTEISAGYDVFKRRIVAPVALNLLGSVSYVGVNANLTASYAPDTKNSFLANITYTGREKTLGIVNPAVGTTDLQYARTLPHKFSLTINLVDFFVPQTLSTRFRGAGVTGVERVRRSSRLVRIGLSRTF